MKFKSLFLESVSLDIIKEAKEDSLLHLSVKINGNVLSEKITLRWVQNFMQSKNIVMRAQCGKLLVSKKKTRVC